MKATVVAFEYPGYSKPYGTKGKATLPSTKWVTLTALNWVRQMWGFLPKDIILIGRSIGTGVAAEVAATYERAGHPLGGLILISPYGSIRSLVTSVVDDALTKIAQMEPEEIPSILSAAAGQIKAGSVSAYATDSYSFDTLENVRVMLNTPVILFHGKLDELIPYQHSEDIYGAMPDTASGRQIKILLYDADHNNILFERARRAWGL